MSIADLPPELLFRIMELSVEGLPASFKIRSEILRNFSLVHSSWREDAQILMETKIQLGSYVTAKLFIDRPRRLERRVIIEELEVFFDFVSVEDDEVYPLTEWILKSFLTESVDAVKSLNLRSALFMNAFDTSLLLLPAFKELRHLRLEMPIEPPIAISSLPLQLTKLSLSEMMDQPLPLFRTLLANSADTLISLHLFVMQSGSPLHQRVLEVLPNLPLTLRHLSISSHWVPLPESLLRLATTCQSLVTLVLSGIDFDQVLYLVSTIPSNILALDFTIPASSKWTDEEAQSTFDRLLELRSLRLAREMTITQRLSKGGISPTHLMEFRGQQMCKCTWERTLRELQRPLPVNRNFAFCR